MGVGKKKILGGREVVNVAIVQKASRFLDKEASLTRAESLHRGSRNRGRPTHRLSGSLAGRLSVLDRRLGFVAASLGWRPRRFSRCRRACSERRHRAFGRSGSTCQCVCGHGLQRNRSAS